MIEINPFRSFWMGGYECTDKMNYYGHRVDFIKLTGHLELIDQDYQMLEPFKIKTVREGIRWSQVEKVPFQYDWNSVKFMMEHAKKNNIQQVWDICHFGFPDDLSPFHPQFTQRFVALCRAFVRFYRSIEPNDTLIITPINEVSFISWLGGEIGGTTPYVKGQGWEMKYHLMRAYIAGSKALLEEDPTIRLLTTEPLVNIVPPADATIDQIAEAAAAHLTQYQSLDMLCGNMCPELGGSPELLDILGFNFYYNNQWILGFGTFLPWLNEFPDERWVPLRQLLSEAYHRYKRPIALTETSHPQKDRHKWMNFIGRECAAVLEEGIPFWGICLYPIIDRPDWDHGHPWHEAGLWDMQLQEGKPPIRILNESYANALIFVQNSLEKIMDKEETIGEKMRVLSDLDANIEYFKRISRGQVLQLV